MTSILRRFAPALVAIGVLAGAQAQPAPGHAKRLWSPQNSAVIMIDHQSQLGSAAQSIDRTRLTNNAVALARTAKAFSVPTILTTVAEERFSGPTFGGIKAVLEADAGEGKPARK